MTKANVLYDPFEIMDSQKPSVQKEIRVLSLFSGGGGLDIAFRIAGCKIVASSEIVPQFCESLKANSWLYGKDHQVICADICNFSPKNYNIHDIDFVIGGPPCQSFSAAGRRAGGVYGVNDIRGSLFWHYCRILKELRPKGFLFENVRGILSANSSHAWEIIQSSFKECGYKIFYKVLDAAEFGVPQYRERVIMIGVDASSNLQIKFPLPLYGPKGALRNTYRGAEECMLDLQNPSEEYKPYGGMYEECLREIPPGMNYLFFTEKMGHPEPRFAWRSRFSDFLYVADPKLPTKTIVASPGKWCGPFHWKKRRFSVSELKRLFTFPDKYILTGTEAIQIKQLGNSVPSLFGFNLALTVMMQFFNDRCNAHIALAEDGYTYNIDTRKGQKARATRQRVKPNVSIYNLSDQMEFDFGDVTVPDFPNIKKSLTIHYSHPRKLDNTSNCDNTGLTVTYDATLSNGVWDLEMSSDAEGGNDSILKLDFIKPICGNFRQIIIRAKRVPDEYIATIWDAADFCVSSSSSYDSIKKLYGHFCEPHPQFASTFDLISDVRGPYFQFAKALILEQNLSEIQTLGVFPFLSPLGNNLSDIVKQLRTHGFDVRSHDTNRTIPEGKVRICYPFTMSLNEMRFTSWYEKGTHKTADRTSIPNLDKLI